MNSSVQFKNGAVWSYGEESVFAHSFKVKNPHTLTGAGDAWDAANILSKIIGLGEEEQLVFSNAYASLYITSPFSEPPTLQETLKFLEKNNAT